MDLDIFEVVKHFGPFAGFTIFFVWQGWIRERKLSERIDRLESEQKETLTKLVTESTSTLARNTVVMENNSEIMEHVVRILESQKVN